MKVDFQVSQEASATTEEPSSVLAKAVLGGLQRHPILTLLGAAILIQIILWQLGSATVKTWGCRYVALWINYFVDFFSLQLIKRNHHPYSTSILLYPPEPFPDDVLLLLADIVQIGQSHR